MRGAPSLRENLLFAHILKVAATCFIAGREEGPSQFDWLAWSLFERGSFAGKLSAKMFGVTKEEAKATFFRVFQQYRLAFVVLNLVPYIALTLMA